MHLTWWQWALAALGGLAILVLVAYGVGALLPVRHTATVSARFDAPTDTVWALITDVDAFPDWRPDVRSVTRLDDGEGAPTWREETRFGGLTFEAVTWEPPHRVTARIADEGLAFGGSWTYEVAEDGTGARLTITEDGEVYNPLFRFMSRFVFGHERTIRSYLDAARTRLARDGAIE